MGGGMCNSFFGWGHEDFFFKRNLKESGLRVAKLRQNTVGSNCTNTFRHIHANKRQKRDKKKCSNESSEPACVGGSGPKHLKYNLESVEEKKIGNATVTFLNVKLFCNLQETPWCSKDCSRK